LYNDRVSNNRVFGNRIYETFLKIRIPLNNEVDIAKLKNSKRDVDEGFWRLRQVL